MSKLGYKIVEEKVIYEKKIYYVIIRFTKGHQKYYFMDYYLGPMVRKNNNDYVNYLSTTKQEILNRLPKKYIFQYIKNKFLIYLLKKELS
jgi:tRNA A22 N-methylase